MSPIRNLTCAAMGASVALITPAAADEATIQALSDRVAQLEQQVTSGPQLSFGGANTTLEIYGYVKADLIYDLDADLGTTFFGLATEGPGEENFRAQAIQSRIGILTTTQTGIGEIRGQIEGDFFGVNGAFRLRHANVTAGNWLVGQFWTNFMPIESYPGTLDFQGPAGITFARQTQLRYTYDLGNGLGVSASIEQANGDTNDPVLTAAASYSTGNAFVKLSALTGTVNGATTEVDRYGVTLSGNAQLWEGGSVNATYTIGEGIGSYFVFGGADTVGDTAVETEGYTVGITQALGDQFSVAAAYGYRENDIGAVGSVESLETLHLTASYSPVENLSIGAEYIIGERTDFGGGSFEADRIQTSVQFNF